jgi:hypothetical protein
LAANRTPNRMGIRMENRKCRQPLTITKYCLKLTIIPCQSVVRQ